MPADEARRWIDAPPCREFMPADTSRLRMTAGYFFGKDLAERLAHADWIVRQQSEALVEAADEIDSLRAMVVTLTQELERCKTRHVSV